MDGKGQSQNQGRNSRQMGQRNPDAMDTSAGAIRKATTEEEKQRYLQEGRCFFCGIRGHLSRTCPKKTKAPRAASASTSDISEPPQYEDLKRGETLANYALKLGREEKDAFLRKVMETEKDNDLEDFASA